MKFPVVSDAPSDIKFIRAWLNGFKHAIVSAFQTVYNLDVESIVPDKAPVGTIKYFSASAPAPITSEGLWVLTSTGWEKCNN